MSKTGKKIVWAVVILALVVLAVYVVKSQLTSIPTISWTMPGDRKSDGSYRRVAGHELRYSPDSALMAGNPLAGASWSPMPAVADRGTPMSIQLPGLVEDRRYFFRYRAVDSVGLFSGWSNQPFKVGGDVTPPETVTDLR